MLNNIIQSRKLFNYFLSPSQINRHSSNDNYQNNQNNSNNNLLNLNTYHKHADKTLDCLSEKFDCILEEHFDEGADVSLSNGVLTLVINTNNTYVINKQTPNRQIWLSSPLSGPKRFDYVDGKWREKLSGKQLNKLLKEEVSLLLKRDVEC